MLLSIVCSLVLGVDPAPLPGTRRLTESADLAERVLSGVEKFLGRELERAESERGRFWKRDPSSAAAYEKSVEPNRLRFRRIIGVVDERLPVKELEYVGGTSTPSLVARTERYTIHAVRWPALDGVDGEGLLLQPVGKPIARIVALPDADQTPEMLVGLVAGIPKDSQFARRLAENGCQVVVPMLIDRKDTWSGNPKIWMTNQTHREWIYRPAFEFGRHIIGYEVQKVLAAIDWFARDGGPDAAIGVAGYGEGGLIAFYAAAVDRRIKAAMVSGYFDNRQRIQEEPIYRNVFGLLREFGDAEIASLIAPRTLIVEHSEAPKVDGPPTPREGRKAYAAPGALKTLDIDSVRKEVDRARKLMTFSDRSKIGLELTTGGPGGDAALLAFLRPFGFKGERLLPSDEPPRDARRDFDPAARQQRQVRQLVDQTQHLLAHSNDARKQFWNKARTNSLDDWKKTTAEYRDYLRDEIIGSYPKPTIPINPRTRKILDRPKWEGFEVVLDVFPDVIVWGYLLVPKDLKSGERRPVVVCQHGLEGVPADVVNEDPKSQGYTHYKAFAVRLAERGFVTFAPHNCYRGGNRFRQLQRLANPAGASFFGVIVAQHDRLLDWLSELPFVDKDRIGFYGLSYGGFSAMRIPALLDRYALSIDSAEFNDMARKKASVHDIYSYPFYNTYEVFEFNFSSTFNYSDLAGLIAPRPFMVERGHRDGVAPDEWVAAEYAKVRLRYADLKIPERTAIEFFDGPHTINGVGTFEFLHRHLEWPERKP